MLIFDIEANGFLDEVTEIHVLVIRDTISGQVGVFSKDTMAEGLKVLMEDYPIGGHNVIKYDIPVIKKLYPWFTVDEAKVFDTLVAARLIWADLSDIDNKLIAQGRLDSKLFRSQSLKAWGQRLGEHKGEPNCGFKEWSQELEDYCVQDTVVTAKLYEKVLAKSYSQESLRLEHDVAWIIARQERHGFYFHRDRAAKLYTKLVQRKQELEQELQQVFKPWYAPKLVGGKHDVLNPKGDNKKHGYTAGAKLTKVELKMFNPASRDHIADRLKKLYGWKPDEFTEGGKPKVDEVVLSKLRYPEAKPLAEYFLVNKRIGQVAEGDEAWLKNLGSDSRIHGGVNTNGAVTGRMTHSKPNLAQVPAGYSPYGHECRECFGVPPFKKKKLVGADASALELRNLAGRMAKYDGGAYVLTVTKGKKEDGTEIHTVNRKALEIESRDVAKTWFYAFIYGAGDEKLGLILGYQAGNKARKAGRESREKFMANLPALGQLVTRVKAYVAKHKNLKGLDGRILHVRSEHSALNTLLQSDGAVIMKRALVILDRDLQAQGLQQGINYEFVANVHDEWQIEVDEEYAELVGQAAAKAITKAGEYYNFGCPQAGEYKIGNNWAETH